MKSFSTLALVATLALVGMATAEPLATVPDASGMAGGDVYLNDDATVWQESNGLDGLQTSETTLEDGSVVPADSQLA